MSNNDLHTFLEDVTGDDHLRVQDDLGNGYVRLRAAEAQRRQAKQDIRSVEDVVIEMLRNSRDAGAHFIFLATWTEGSKRFLTVLDDGCGIPKAMHDTIFEPFVTSKLDSFHEDRWGVHGRGMALYSIRQNAESAQVAASAPGLGSAIAVTCDTDQLPEKKDQSTLPKIVKDDAGNSVLRGPHNIARTAMEFAIDERGSVAVYVGSSSEIVATLYSLGIAAAGRTGSFLDSYTDDTPFIQRFGMVADAEDLASLSCSLQMPLSSRTARRILDGQIDALPTQLELFAASQQSTKPEQKTVKAPRVAKPAHGIRIAHEDLVPLQKAVDVAVKDLGRRYYLENEPNVAITTHGSRITVQIDLDANN